MVAEGRRWSYSALLRDVKLVAGSFQARAYRRGDRLAVFADNHPATVITWLAGAMTGVPGKRRQLALDGIGARLCAAAAPAPGRSSPTPGPEVLESEPYRRLIANPSPWTQRIRSTFDLCLRAAYIEQFQLDATDKVVDSFL